MQTHQGSCHRGNVRFEMDTDVSATVVCNCSFCVRRNAILHHFCPHCGIQCFGRQSGKGRFGSRVNVNMGCFDPSLVEGITPFEFDGASMPEDSRLWE